MAELLVVPGVMIFGVNQGTLRQIITADAFQGRTNATFGVVLGGCTATGALAGGACAELVGIPALLLVAATASIGGGLWLLRSHVWELEQTNDDEEPTRQPVSYSIEKPVRRYRHRRAR